MSHIRYSLEKTISAAQAQTLYAEAGLPGPSGDLALFARMLEQATLVVSAWDNDLLVGMARCFTDGRFCCYVSELAVRRTHQRSGIGRGLLDAVRSCLDGDCAVVLLAEAQAGSFYTRCGFSAAPRAFIAKASCLTLESDHAHSSSER